MSFIPHDRIQSVFSCLYPTPFLIGLGAIATILAPGLTPSAVAQPSFSADLSAQTNPLIQSQILFNAPPLPESQEAPSGRREGGASRGSCDRYTKLTALAPVIEERVIGQTTATHPTFWFYSPAAIEPETPIEFILQDGYDTVVDYAVFQQDAEAGVYAYTPNPQTSSALIPGQTYQWTLAIYCDLSNPASFVYIKGSIERVDIDGLEVFSDETERSIEQMITYAEAGVWYDALTIFAELRQDDPDDSMLASAWSEFLGYVDLEWLGQAPIQDCCSNSFFDRF